MVIGSVGADGESDGGTLPFVPTIYSSTIQPYGLGPKYNACLIFISIYKIHYIDGHIGMNFDVKMKLTMLIVDCSLALRKKCSSSIYRSPHNRT